MQLDFLSRLIGRVTAAGPSKERQQRPSSKPVSCSGDVDPALTRRARELLHGQGADRLEKIVRVRWNSRMRSTAGTAWAGQSLIVLNPRLREFGDEEVDRTLRHELAHLLAHARVGRRRIAPHGTEWQKACADLGLAGEQRCHNLPLPRREMQRRHAYRCPGCNVTLTRVKPLRRKSACLACCRANNGGRYDERYRFTKVVLPPQP